MSETGVIRGFKVFNPDWTCRDKQYTCPGAFEEDVAPSVCDRGMHFCKKAADCFNYYSFNPENKVAEVIALAERTVEDGDKCATNYLEIVREISWQEVLEIVNLIRCFPRTIRGSARTLLIGSPRIVLWGSFPLQVFVAVLQVLTVKQAATMVLERMGRSPFVWTRETVLGVLPAMPTISGQLRLNVLPTRNTPTL